MLAPRQPLDKIRAQRRAVKQRPPKSLLGVRLSPGPPVLIWQALPRIPGLRCQWNKPLLNASSGMEENALTFDRGKR